MSKFNMWMTATLMVNISFIQSLFLTKSVGLNSNLNPIFLVEIPTQSKMLQRFGMHFSERGLVLDYICSVKYGAFCIVARPYFDSRNFFIIFSSTTVFLR